ncbi:MAG: hypothetical protein LUE96_00305 [Lachnospiraceae bacterium]|nr:hypothetical protein [Lachnospiraceae bacterium]
MSISAISGISGLSGLSGLGGYRISSVNGNPYSLQAVSRIEEGADNRRGRALIIGQKSTEDDLYVKDYGELESTQSTATGDFAELLSMQESAAADDETAAEAWGASKYTSYINDTIGMMGFQNGLREQLSGAGFIPF